MVIVCRIAVTLLAVLFGIAGFADDRISGDDDKAIKSSFQQMSGFAASGEWKKAAELMTPQAADEVCAQMLMLCLGIRDAEFPMSIPHLDEARDEIEKVLSEFKLDQVELEVTMFRFAGAGSDKDEEDLQKKAAENQDKALQALANVQDRWAVIAKLQSAVEGMPFGNNVALSGEISEIEIAEDKALVTIKPQPPQQNSEGGVQIQIIAPPRIANYQKVNDQWLYAGINREKTDAAMREFQKSMPMQPGATDF